jgi:multiple sugar transport system ATP-binding protein
VAQVVIEDVYKSYPARQGDRTSASVSLPSGALSPDPTKISPPGGGGNSILRRINLQIQDGEFLVLVGPSGCGKSTLLRLIAGLESLTAGNIWVGDRLVNQLPPKARDIAMVFQSYALYPHMSVYNNLAFGLRRTPAHLQITRKPGRFSLPAPLEALLVAATRPFPKGWRYISPQEQAISGRVKGIAEILQIESLLQRLPKQLSGGQKQRVALGRAMARNPQVFLMDEPLSNLDAKLRAETRAQIVKLQRQLKTTTLYVTHDQTEAMTMGDRIAVMNGGQIQQLATPLELYNHPANKFVAEFIGSPPMNFLPVQVTTALTLKHPAFDLRLAPTWNSLLQTYHGQSLILGIRAEHFALAEVGVSTLSVQVELVEALGHETYLLTKLLPPPAADPADSTHLQIRINPNHPVQRGDRLCFSLNPEKIHLFDPETGLSLRPLTPDPSLGGLSQGKNMPPEKINPDLGINPKESGS